jgi:plastocyanin
MKQMSLRIGLTIGIAVVALSMTAARYRAPATHLVRMTASSFVPAETRVRAGDTVRFVNGMGGPHNVEFAGDSIGAAARTLLDAAMPGDKIGPLSGPLVLDEDETYAVVIPDLRPGRYAYFCRPHLANMRGGLTVTR